MTTPTTKSEASTSLAAWSAARGGVAGAAAICPVASYGDPGLEYAALREGAGLWDRGAWGLLRFSGPDRLTFLNKYATQEVKTLAAGAGAYACCLTVKGGMVADLWVLAREDDALVLVTPAARATLLPHLSKYALFDKVKLAPADDLAVMTLWGPRAAEVAAAVVGHVPSGELAHATVSWSGHQVQVVRDLLPGLRGVDLLAPRDAAPALADALLAAGARPVGSEALEQARVEDAFPLFGVDLDERTIPIEAGLEARAISFTKGCYIGQEVIARISHRGHVNRTLAGVRLSALPERTPAPLLREGKEVGALTSAVRSPRAGGPAGLCLLHRKHADPGTVLEVGSGGPTATVVALPLT
jgi:folate-binding protein YgfZ